jgi:Skp family chaperone for outer membrane proteins
MAFLLPFVAVALLAGVVASPLAAQRTLPLRLGIVDSRVLLDSTPGRASAEARYQHELAEAQRAVDAAADSLRLAADDFARTQATLSAPQREAAMHVLRARELAVEDFVQRLSVAAERRRSMLRGEVEARVREAVRTYRRREGLTLILDRAELGPAADHDAAIDVTAGVLRVLREAPR